MKVIVWSTGYGVPDGVGRPAVVAVNGQVWRVPIREVTAVPQAVVDELIRSRYPVEVVDETNEQEEK